MKIQKIIFHPLGLIALTIFIGFALFLYFVKQAPITTPGLITRVADPDWKMVTAGHSHTLAIRTNGTLWTWGNNQHGQLGLGHTDYYLLLFPTQVGTDTDWKMVTAGHAHTLAIKTNGTLWAWGDNAAGQLGLGDTAHRFSPIQVGTDTDWKMVTAGHAYALAIRINGTLWAWGDNRHGQLGLGDRDNRFPPTQVGTDTDWKMVTAGSRHTMAIKTNGTLWAWGDNDTGRLGLRVRDGRSSPIRVRTAIIDWEIDWKMMATEDSHTLAIKTNGTLWAWGCNRYGQLGLGDTAHRFSPIQVGTDTDWKMVTAGHSHTLAIKNNGTLWTWGNNQHGQLGLGDRDNRYSPTQVVYLFL